MMRHTLWVIASTLVLAMVLTGCASDSQTTGTGSACTKNADCAASGGAVCCAGECKQAASCSTCGTTADLAGDWNWRIVCLDSTGLCPVRDDTDVVTITQTSGSPSFTATVTGSDDLAGVICNGEVEWAETGSGTGQGCWTLGAGGDQFNQRSIANGGQWLCLGVGARVGASLPAVPDCAALQAKLADGAGTFRVCPPPPPAAP